MKFKLILISSLLFILNPAQAKLTSAEQQQQMTPKEALKELRQGNERFVNEKPLHRDLSKKRELSARLGQFPHSLVFHCIDSRSNPGILFDQGVGNIFTSSIAGNVVDVDVIAGMEFATSYAGSKLIVVMGHTQCGAVQAACKGIGTENIKKLTSKIMPAVKQLGQKNCQQYEEVNKIARQNVLNQMESIIKQSPPIQKLLNDKQIALVGGMHDLKTGKVTFFNKEGNEVE